MRERRAGPPPITARSRTPAGSLTSIAIIHETDPSFSISLLKEEKARHCTLDVRARLGHDLLSLFYSASNESVEEVKRG
jgi:hypothetical protein